MHRSNGCGCIFEETAKTLGGCRVLCKGLLLPLRNAKGATTLVIGAYTYDAHSDVLEGLFERGVESPHLHEVIFVTP